MNRRAARRQSTATSAQKQGRAATARSVLRGGTGGSKTPPARRSGGRGIRGLLYPEWARNIVSELRKVIWPTREETQNLTVVVIVVAVAVGIILGVLDFVFSWLVEQTLL